MPTIIRGAPQPTDLDAALAIGQADPDVDPTAPAATGPAAIAQAAVAKARRKGRPLDPNHVGIVCLHGIGSQAAGQTLLEWTEPIIRALVTWRARNEGALVGAREPIDGVERSQIDFDGSTYPLVSIELPGLSHPKPETGPKPPNSPRQTWTFTEAWWAASIMPPTLRAMVDWNGRDGVFAEVVSEILANSMGRHRGLQYRLPATLARLGLRLFVSTFATLVLLGYQALLAVAGILPIPGLKDSAVLAGFQSFLIGWWGDARVLVRDPVQAANVRSRLVGAIRALRGNGCGSIVVIAHSGGTIVAYQTLQDPQYQDLGVDKLITHGEAIGLARKLGDDRAGDAPKQDDEHVGDQRRQVALAVDRLSRHGDPIRVTRWRDFWGTHDPAPNGSLPDLTNAEGSHPKEPRLWYRVWNRMSILEDHGEYWSNDEEFVLRVIRELDTAATPTDLSRFPDPAKPLDRAMPHHRHIPSPIESRHERVLFRSVWLRTALVAPIVALLLTLEERWRTGYVPPSIGDLRAAVAGVWNQLPTHDQINGLFDSIRRAFGSARVITDVGIAAWIFVAMIVITFGSLRAGRSKTWLGRRERILGGGLDWGLWLAVIVAGVLAAGGIVFGPAIVPEVLNAIVAGLAVFGILVLWLLTSEWLYDHVTPRWLKQFGAEFGQALRSGVALIVVFGGIAAMALAPILDEPVADWLLAGAATFALVQVVARVGGWRWDAWDDRERQAIRATWKAGSRFSAYAELAGLLGVMGAIVVWVGIGYAPALPAAVVIVAVVILFAAIRDASTAERPR